MWTSKCRFANAENVCQISILQSDKPALKDTPSDNGIAESKGLASQTQRIITYAEVIQLWQQNFDFRAFFISLLANSPYEAYFWETPPITRATCDRSFEFVLVNNPRLARVKPNYRSFRQYFQSGEDIVTFANLRKDALLVVPCPLTDESAYPHIANFVRNAPQDQQHLLWQTVGKEIETILCQRPLWISTSGLGVYWLHIRLDSYPKYYSYQPYKKNPLPM